MQHAKSHHGPSYAPLHPVAQGRFSGGPGWAQSWPGGAGGEGGAGGAGGAGSSQEAARQAETRAGRHYKTRHQPGLTRSILSYMVPSGVSCCFPMPVSRTTRRRVLPCIWISDRIVQLRTKGQRGNPRVRYVLHHVTAYPRMHTSRTSWRNPVAARAKGDALRKGWPDFQLRAFEGTHLHGVVHRRRARPPPRAQRAGLRFAPPATTAAPALNLKRRASRQLGSGGEFLFSSRWRRPRHGDRQEAKRSSLQTCPRGVRIEIGVVEMSTGKCGRAWFISTFEVNKPRACL